MWTANEKPFLTLTVLGLAIIALSIPLYLGRIKRNGLYGFRIRKAFASDENWYRINRYGAAAFMIWALVLLAVGVVCLFLPPEHVLYAARVGFISMVVPLLLTLAYARRL